LRILVLGMDTGRPDGGVTMDQRRQQIYARIPEPFSKRNPHMRGTTLALRVLFGREQWQERREEFLELNGEPVHLLDAYAMANVRLCSAINPGSTKSKGTRTMSRNCLRHLRATVEILQPQVVVLQGARIRESAGPLMRDPDRLGPNLERVELAGVPVLLASFGHPSYPGPKGNWSWPSSSYFAAVVVPALQDARRLAIDA
jgi:hypothetical protein